MDKITITNSFYNAVEDGEVLSINDNIFFEFFEDNMDGVFPRVNEWTRFMNNIDNKGLEYWLNKNLRYYNIKNYENIGHNTYNIEFNKPIKCSVAKIGDKHIIKHIKKMQVEFNCQGYFLKNGRQDKYVNGINITFNIMELVE